MSSENQYRHFAVASIDLSERGKTLVDKSRPLIVAAAWLDLAEHTTELVQRETDAAHKIIEPPLSSVTSPYHR